ncbi:MAG: hypothetical protein HY296_03770 [Thaumarchaeota archaeon]|nr:hypothetical protein [Nitrososphaerota archaeon]
MDPLVSALLILAVAFLSNVSPFFGASYTLFATLQLIQLGQSPSNFLLVVGFSAVGATAAKVVMYYGAFGFRGALTRNRNVQLIGRNSSRRVFYLVLFATALLPVLPLDDFIFIGAGATRASLGRMSAVTLLAKSIKSTFEIAIEVTILGDIGGAFGFNDTQATIALGVVFLLVGVAIYKVDWASLFRNKKLLLDAGTAAETKRSYR